MRFRCYIRVERPDEGGMCAYGSRKNNSGGIGDRISDGQGAGLDAILDFEPEGERVDLPALRIILEQQAAGGRAALRETKGAVTGKPMLRHAIRLTLVDEGVIHQPADNREQHRSMARPLRPPLP